PSFSGLRPPEERQSPDCGPAYINMKTQKISKHLSKRFTTPVWIKVLESTFRNMSSFRLSPRRAWERQVRPRGLLRLRNLAPRDLHELLHRIVHGGVSTRTLGKKARLTTKCSRGRGRVCFGNRTHCSRAEWATRVGSTEERVAASLERDWGLAAAAVVARRTRRAEAAARAVEMYNKIFFLIGLCCETSGAGGTAIDKSNKNKWKAPLRRSKGSLGSLDVVAVKNNNTTEILQNVIASSRDTTLSEPAKFFINQLYRASFILQVGDKPSSSFQV
ncbi:hypothetical protein ACJX0J_012504, partial [Zea mays]